MYIHFRDWREKERERERAAQRACFSGPLVSIIKKKKKKKGGSIALSIFEIMQLCSDLPLILPTSTLVHQSACQQINTICKDNSSGAELTVISQISDRPREDAFPKTQIKSTDLNP